jgi:hypothetical protein
MYLIVMNRETYKYREFEEKKSDVIARGSRRDSSLIKGAGARDEIARSAKNK